MRKKKGNTVCTYAQTYLQLEERQHPNTDEKKTNTKADIHTNT